MLASMSSMELTAWFEYLRIDDEVRTQRITYAIIKAFGGGTWAQQQTASYRTDDEEEIIDTTDPNFTKFFQGFSYEKSQQPRRRPRRQTNTEIKFG
jgi:hypothetical protein